MDVFAKLIAWFLMCALLFGAVWLAATAMGCAADALSALAM